MKSEQTLKLTTEERLELQNLEYKRKLLELQLGQQLVQVEQGINSLVAKIKKRTQKDIRDYKVNLDTGEGSKLTKEELAQGQKQNVVQAQA
jgi:hypothetical protein